MGPKMRMTQVLSVTNLSPHMRRIIVTGDELKDFPIDRKSAHVKAIFPRPNAANNMPKLGMYIGFKQWMRSYTIREFDPQSVQLTLDFAVNDHQGLASNWAANAVPGDHLGIAGPGDTKHPDLYAESHLMFGDITALPAIAGILELMPEDAKGQVWIQVPDPLDIQVLRAPVNMDINWLVTPDKLTGDFLQGLKSQTTALSDTAIFIATEASIVKQLKAHLNEHCQYDKANLYASAYWNKKR